MALRPNTPSIEEMEEPGYIRHRRRLSMVSSYVPLDKIPLDKYLSAGWLRLLL